MQRKESFRKTIDFIVVAKKKGELNLLAETYGGGAGRGK